MPKGIPYILANEVAERFSFYGMKTLLPIFMTQYLLSSAGTPDLMTDEEATAWIHWFIAAAYFFPIVGAVIADAFWGKYKTVLYVSLLYCVGHGLLALMDVTAFVQGAGIEPRWLLAAGLGVIAVGAGGIKPCVSAILGDQFGSTNKSLISKAFGWFYLGINLGAFASSLWMPILLRDHGPAIAFGVPGVFMALATLFFWLGRKRFVQIPPQGRAFFRETISRDGLIALGKLVPLYLFIAIFFSLYDQSGSRWVLQATRLDLDIGLFGWSHVIEPAQVQAVNPLLILTLIPIFNLFVYPFVGRFVRLTPLRKIGAGFVLVAASFVVTAQIEVAHDQAVAAARAIGADPALPSVWWQILAWVLLTAAEILVWVTALEFSYTQAPRKMKSFVMGVALLSTTVGNMITAIFNEHIDPETMPQYDYYMTFVWLMLATTVVYVVFSLFYKPKEYLQDEAPAT